MEPPEAAGAASAAADAVAGDLRAVVGQLLRRSREQAEANGLTEPESAVLSRLKRVGIATTKELAHAEGIPAKSMPAVLAGLQIAELVEGSENPKDRYDPILSLSDLARDQSRTTWLSMDDWLSRALTADFTPEEIEQLAQSIPLLERISRA
jgi:DNA-binding MarR family transcriptional regulator